MRQGLDFTDGVHFEHWEGEAILATLRKEKIIKEIGNVMASCCKCLKARFQAPG
jgi:hypothetical protein